MWSERSSFRRLAALLSMVVALVSVGGCKTSPLQDTATAEMTPAERKLREDQRALEKTVIGGIITGAAIGASVSAVLTAIRGGNSDEIKRSAGAGAIAGGVLGGIDGYVTAKRNQSQKDEVRAIQAAAADVRKDNQSLQSMVTTSTEVLREGQARLVRLKSDVQSRQVSVAQADEARKREAQNIETMQKALSNAQKTRDDYQKASAKFQGTIEQKRNLDAEIAQMNRQIGQLESNLNQYTKALEVSRA